MVQVAKERMDSQNAWNALTVKVPAFSPWAPNGYARLLTQVEAAEKVLKKSKKELTQDEINAAASALNVSINTMRPGNLAEPEDLKNLMTLLQQAVNTSNKTTPHARFPFSSSHPLHSTTHSPIPYQFTLPPFHNSLSTSIHRHTFHVLPHLTMPTILYQNLLLQRSLNAKYESNITNSTLKPLKFASIFFLTYL